MLDDTLINMFDSLKKENKIYGDASTLNEYFLLVDRKNVKRKSCFYKKFKYSDKLIKKFYRNISK